ncbi:hypothetical protein ACVW0P_000957 [Mucilaginibacter sp. UYNi724]
MKKIIFYLLLFATFSTNAQVSEKITSSDTTVFSVVEQPPVFPGGDAALSKYIFSNKIYKSVTKDEEVQTRIAVSFIVEKNGSLSNFNIIKPKNTSLERQVVRIIKASPKWEPAMQNGKVVRCRYMLPISCMLFATE